MEFLKTIMTKLNNITTDYKYSSELKSILRTSTNSNPKPNELFGGIDNDFWLWLITTGYKNKHTPKGLLPGLPEESVQLHFTGSAGGKTLMEGFNAYVLFKGIYEKYAGSISECENILDFGCGWGRTIRFFMRDIEPSRLWGIDANPELIAECKNSNSWCNFEVSNTIPSINFSENTFDLVYCYSVFSHLSEETHEKWITEFSRTLKPSGILIVTTWQREYIERCNEIRNMDQIPHWLNTPASAFLDTEKALYDYDNGDFCFSPVGKGEWSFFGEACISEAYVKNHWSDRYSFLEFITDRRQCPQNVIVVQKAAE